MPGLTRDGSGTGSILRLRSRNVRRTPRRTDFGIDRFVSVPCPLAMFCHAGSVEAVRTLDQACPECPDLLKSTRDARTPMFTGLSRVSRPKIIGVRQLRRNSKSSELSRIAHHVAVESPQKSPQMRPFSAVLARSKACKCLKSLAPQVGLGS